MVYLYDSTAEYKGVWLKLFGSEEMIGEFVFGMWRVVGELEDEVP